MRARSAISFSSFFGGVWRGTASELRSFVEELASAGATWFVVQAAGPADRLDLIAETLRG